jgi:hypothetical protein
VDVDRSDQSGKVFRTINVSHAPWDDKFRFDGCAATGAEGQRCAKDLKVPKGVRILKDANDDVVGTGVCCNSVSDRVLSATRTNCTADPLPPPSVKEGSYYVSVATSVIVAEGATDVTFEGLEIRYSRGPGVILNDCVDVGLRRCAVSDHGMMGVNVTGGSQCSVVDSDVSGNGDGGVMLMGGDRTTLQPSHHNVTRSTLHRNQVG